MLGVTNMFYSTKWQKQGNMCSTFYFLYISKETTASCSSSPVDCNIDPPSVQGVVDFWATCEPESYAP